ncbi:MAG TPA: cellulose binding domain-containing protein [Actinocrinis sp.]|nr:cellulose binding domain-containing protein [Actinocrinis sp.]
MLEHTPTAGRPRRAVRRRLLAAAAVVCATTAVYPAVMMNAQAATPALSVLYKTSTGAVADEAEPWFEVVNNTSSAIPYSQITLRYYFTADANVNYTFACAWAVAGCSNLSGTVAALPTPTATADHYLQITFKSTAGSLAAGANSGDLELRLYRSDWQNVNQADDYSFNAADTSYTAWSKVTAYQNGNLVWGTEPSGATANPTPTGTGTGTPTPTPTGTGTGNPTSPPPTSGVLFDDFNYTSSSDPNLAAHDWTVRTEAGGPGVTGATWSPNAVTFPASTAAGGSHVLNLAASTDGTSADTVQSELDTTSQKFFQGTYAARVYFNDAPTTGPNGDDVNETFYSISPDNALYSEDDFEYLPNGGWGGPPLSMYTTSWYSADALDRVTTDTQASLQGWHTLVETVANGTVTYFIDGTQVFSSTGKYYPREDMTIDFNEWFINGYLAGSSTPRTWNEQVGWVYYANNTALTPAQVQANVTAYQHSGTSFTDTVPAS